MSIFGNVIRQMLEMLLTGVIKGMALFTCCFIFYQPEMPAEMDDFRKYNA